MGNKNPIKILFDLSGREKLKKEMGRWKETKGILDIKESCD